MAAGNVGATNPYLRPSIPGYIEVNPYPLGDNPWFWHRSIGNYISEHRTLEGDYVDKKFDFKGMAINVLKAMAIAALVSVIIVCLAAVIQYYVCL